ncbi:MAG: NAD(P)/FAD-dependent oxidoreductase [Candidatus Acidiferrales bacterium]
MAATPGIVILGAGHNGLVTAFYLARAGLKPLVLERRSVVGGAAATGEFHPGFKCSTLAHACGPLLPSIMRDMQLEKHGLSMLQSPVRVFAPLPDGRGLLLLADPVESASQIEKFSRHDAPRYKEFHQLLARYCKLLHHLLWMTPPAIDHPSGEDLWKLLKVGRNFRGLGKRDMMRLLRWGPMAVADLVAEFFETELLRATIAARGIFGTALGPWSAGSTAVLLLRAAADPHPAGTSAFPRGGMGALAQAMAEAAKQAGAEIRTGAEVAQILVKNGGVTGVALASGEEIPAKAVISNADPRRTFLKLVDPVHLEPGFVVKMQHYRSNGTVAKVNLALNALPAFTALKGISAAGALSLNGAAGALGGRIHIGPEIDYLERAFDDSKYGEFSRAPYLDITIPSILDPSLAPPEKHVMSIHMQFAPYKLRRGDWPSCRDALGDTVIKTLAAYAPDLPNRILARQIITPQDLEDSWGLTGGHPFHGELALDQLFTMRPILGYARHLSPIKALYLCGSGTHPGTGLTGASGSNAAREILKDLRR